MASSQPPCLCPMMHRLISLIARITGEPGAIEQGRLIDQLTDLETQALETGAPRRTIEAIRSVRLTIRVASLKPRSLSMRGH
ncbi:hypothetical protein J2X36_005279 [Methylobacterium sp. BE186]|nr:hypothetical protein [Methylobacterium sp. BE186]